MSSTLILQRQYFAAHWKQRVGKTAHASGLEVNKTNILNIEKLELLHWKNLTDDQLRELGKIFFDKELLIIRKENSIELFCRSSEDFVIFFVHSAEILKTSFIASISLMYFEAYELLRSWGYATPWRGNSVKKLEQDKWFSYKKV